METSDEGNSHAVVTPHNIQEAELAIGHLDCSDQTSDQVIDREIIDEDGDVLIQIGSKEWLVSSKILALASPVFKVMLSSKFIEGSTNRSVQQPLELPLPDDHPDATAVLLHTLHFSSKWKFSTPGAELQFNTALLSDKYLCITSMYSESVRWLRSISEGYHESLALWKLSTVAFLMGHPDEFSSLTAKTVSRFTAAELHRVATNSAFPETVKGISEFLSYQISKV